MRSSLIFRLGCAAVELHVLTDAFAGLEPGVVWTEHLSAALVPTALIVIAGVTFPRLREGFQAAVSLTLGFLALVGGAIAVATLAADGVDAAVITGLLMLPAGAGLVGLGVVLLWRSRKPTGRPVIRRALITVASFVVWFELILPIALALVATHRPAGAVEAGDLGRPHTEVAVRTGDGLELGASYVPSENGKAVITYPSREGAADHARMLAQAGFGVLALDARGYGSSEGDPNAFGWGSSKDIEAGVDFLSSRPDVRDGAIGGLGLSVGGEVMIEAAAGDERLGAVVSEGAGERSVREAVLYGLEGLPAIPHAAMLTAATAAFSGDPPPPALDELAAEVSPRSLFLIEAERGQGGEELNADYFEAAREPKELWVVPGAGHTGGLDAEPEEYPHRVTAFFDRALARHP